MSRLYTLAAFLVWSLLAALTAWSVLPAFDLAAELISDSIFGALA